MAISSLHVRNFRSIRDETISCDRLTALIGPNGAGKSSFLKALDLFYHPAATYSAEDFYNQDTTNEITIAITFAELNDEERSLFRKYIVGDTFTVEKVMSWPFSKNSQKYYGNRLKNPEFEACRNAASNATSFKDAYNQLRSGSYTDLPKYSKKDAVAEALQGWEEAHPEQCQRMRDEGQFFGFNEVGEANLERFTRFIYIPPVLEATKEAIDGKNSVMTELMDLVVRKVLMNREDLRDLQRLAQDQYDEIVGPERLPELANLGDQLTKTLDRYAPNTSVSIDWSKKREIEIPMPEARVKLIEDGYPASVDNTGHGLQRAFIITLLQYLTLVQTGEGANSTTALERKQHIILAIEEPELYQHPNRQRYLSTILNQLCSEGIPGTACSVQVIYTTHSPLFVDIGHFERINIIRKIKKDYDSPKETSVTSTSQEAVLKKLKELDGKAIGYNSGTSLESKLITIMKPSVNEGFFSDLVVLVEGEEDLAALIGVAKTMNVDLNSHGISIIPCGGKGSLYKVWTVFDHFRIPLYLIWDSDKDAKVNHRLLKLCCQSEEDYPEGVFDRYTCFKTNLTETIHQEVGEDLYKKTLHEAWLEFGLDDKKAIKNPLFIAELVKNAKIMGFSLSILEMVITRILALRNADGKSV